MEKLKFGNVKKLSQGLPASKCQSWDLSPGSGAPEPSPVAAELPLEPLPSQSWQPGLALPHGGFLSFHKVQEAEALEPSGFGT